MLNTQEPQIRPSGGGDAIEAALAAAVAAGCHSRIFDAIRYWRNARPADDLLPGRQHIDPVDVPKLLPHIGLLDVVREPGVRFKVRLVGTKVTEAVGTGILGRYLDEAIAGFEPSQVGQDYLRCATDGVPVWYRGAQTIKIGKAFLPVERLFLPLAADGRTVDMILAVYLFGTAKAPPKL